jgi:hypothetical protein
MSAAIKAGLRLRIMFGSRSKQDRNGRACGQRLQLAAHVLHEVPGDPGGQEVLGSARRSRSLRANCGLVPAKMCQSEHVVAVQHAAVGAGALTPEADISFGNARNRPWRGKRRRVHWAPGIPHALLGADDLASLGQSCAAGPRTCVSASLRANGSRECAPDDRLREAIQLWRSGYKAGLPRRYAPRNDAGLKTACSKTSNP